MTPTEELNVFKGLDMLLFTPLNGFETAAAVTHRVV